MIHDSNCPQGEGASISTTPYGLEDFPCLCELIAKAREDERSAAVQRVEALNWIIPEGHAGKWVVGYQTPGYPDQPPPNAGLLRTQTIAAIKGDQE